MASERIWDISGLRQLVLILACFQFVSYSLSAFHGLESMEVSTPGRKRGAEDLANAEGSQEENSDQKHHAIIWRILPAVDTYDLKGEF
ncbi:hypothetical protein RRG08_012340 [Elysia crispata]|uniref:Uncharacterized protein n=1 Tax=Elysia crispata TaxID=231223 RepID=A0AAE1DVU2_9GAST|nr:hypothetical protein RRG08_012340 [Elysia crispata]